MVIILLLICIVIVSAYSVYAFQERYRLRKKNEELRDEYRLLRESLELENDSRRARYRIKHEREKIDVIRASLREKYGDHILQEKKILDEVLDYEKEKAKHLSVKFEANVSKNAEDFLLLFSEDEIISFFLNLVDNAIEAAAGSEQVEKKVQVKLDRDLEIINSKKKDCMPGKKTSKAENAIQHGFGLGIIERYCREKNLMIEYTDKESHLVTKIKSK